MLGPILYLLYTNDLPQTVGTAATFAGDTGTLAVGGNMVKTTRKLQRGANYKISGKKFGYSKKLNETKSVYVNFIKKSRTSFCDYQTERDGVIKHSYILGHDTRCNPPMESIR